MHARHRNGPGNGYRANVMGMGMASASRIPTENALRGRRMFSPDHRNYSRGGYASGGHSKQFQPPVSLPRPPDIFVEAGRLAAEYLVSRGVLPPSVLSGKWPSDGLKNMANFQGFRPREVEVHEGGRGSVHSRLGNAVPDVGTSKRRYFEDSSLTGSRASARERKRSGQVKSYGPDVNRDSGHSTSRAEKVSASLGDDASAACREKRPMEKEGKGRDHSLSPGGVPQEVGGEAHIGSGLEKSKISEDEDANDGKCSQLHSADGEQVKNRDETGQFNKVADKSEIKKVTSDEDLQQKHNKTEVVRGEDDMVTEDHIDLVKHAKFLNVPTRARSSSSGKNVKVNREAFMNKDENAYNGRDLPEGSGINLIGVDAENSADNALSRQSPELKTHDCDAPSIEGNVDVNERSIYKEAETDEGLTEFERSNSMPVERGAKRAIELSTDVKEDVKRLRPWVHVLDAQSDGSKSLSCSLENNLLLQEPRTSPSGPSTQLLDQKGLDISIFQKDHAGPCEFIKEKQLFHGSFKTCDLNLVGNGDGGENHSTGRMLVFPSIMHSGKDATPIDVNLSISKNGNLPCMKGKNVNEIEVIDLDEDSAPEDKNLSNPERGDAVFTDLDGFPNTAHNTNGIPDVHDGYGLMISELLGHDSTNCSVPTDLNSLHNHMDLPNTEGILGDDDSIYMSLGEIPISLLGPWEQPTQDYGKPF